VGETKIAIIIVTYNSAQHIEDCLRSVAEQLPRDGSRIVVFDNASIDESCEIVAKRWPNVQLMRSDVNLGFGRACNQAAKEVDAKYILLLNPDAVLQPECIANLLDLARRFPAAGLYGGRVFTPEGLPTYSCFSHLSLWVIWCNSTGLSRIFFRSELLNPQLMGGWAFDTEREVDVIAGSLLLVDTQAWEHLGGFDEQFFLYAEDSDLCRRAANLGYSPIVTPKARIVHIRGASSTSKANALVMLYQGEITLIRKIWSGPRRVIAERILVGGILLRAVLSYARSTKNFNSGREPEDWSALWRRRKEWLAGW
jgi:N-acetylglucosaminyl-diphospho-decaprenol L-rhamnosyltransferase